MKTTTRDVEPARIRTGPMMTTSHDGFNGSFLFCFRGQPLVVISSDGGGWEHVSVSCADRCPTWEEMCFIKDKFWSQDESVVQYHPARDRYVNNHPFCLHLWKRVGTEMSLPPPEYVGVLTVTNRVVRPQ